VRRSHASAGTMQAFIQQEICMNCRNKKGMGLGGWMAIAVGIYTAVHVGQRYEHEGLTAPVHAASAASSVAPSVTPSTVAQPDTKR
jgi:hypothetical protein